MGFFFGEESTRHDPALLRLLSKPTVQDLLYTLTTATKFLATDQVDEWLWLYPRGGFLGPEADPSTTPRPPGNFKDKARSVLHQLEVGGLLGHEVVKHLPPVTIGEAAVLRLVGGADNASSQTVEEAARCADVAKQRVPSIESHRPSRLYFAREKATWLMDDLGHPRGGPVHVSNPEHEVRKLLDEQWAIERRFEILPADIAATTLTALYNLNQFILRRKDWTCGGFASYHAYGNFGPGHPEAKLMLGDKRPVGLFFLRPTTLEEFRTVVDRYLSDYARNYREAWWL